MLGFRVTYLLAGNSLLQNWKSSREEHGHWQVKPCALEQSLLLEHVQDFDGQWLSRDTIPVGIEFDTGS